MRKIIKIIFVLSLFFILEENFSQAAKNKVFNSSPPYVLSSQKSLSLDIPLDFKTSFSTQRPSIINVRPPGKKSYILELEIFPNNELSPVSGYSTRLSRASGKKEIYKYLKAVFVNTQSDILNPNLKIQTFSGAKNKGFYFKATAKNKDNAMGAKYFVHGVFLVKGYLAVFTIKGDYGKSKTDATLLKILKTAKLIDTQIAENKNEQDEKTATMLAFLGNEYQKIKTVKAEATIEEITSESISEKPQKLFFVVDENEQKVKADNKKEQTSFTLLSENFYKYHNLFVKQGASTQGMLLDDLLMTDWFALLTPWRNSQNFMKEHLVKEYLSTKFKKGFKTITAQVYPSAVKFYKEIDITFDISKNRVWQIVYHGKNNNIKAVVYYSYPPATAFVFPNKVKIKFYNNNMLFLEKKITFKNIKINEKLPKNIFSVK